MSEQTTNLSLPYILAAQAQKHVTHNEALRMLDAIVHIAPLEQGINSPPATPAEGDSFLTSATATGAFAGQDNMLAVWQDGAWSFFEPQAGWTAWIRDEQTYLLFDGTDWNEISSGEMVSRLGINATADDINRLSVNSQALLFNHAGDDIRAKLNKNAETDTASFLFQTGFSGRAEIGLTGNDDFSFKVSPDGSTFHNSIIIDKDTGDVNFLGNVTGITDASLGDKMATVDHIISRAGGIITNATGSLGNNYNFSAFEFDASDTPGLPGAFVFAGRAGATRFSDELIPINPTKLYQLECYIKQDSIPGDWSAYANGERHLQYIGIEQLDADDNVVVARNHMRYFGAGNDSLTTLASPLTPGDTSISVVDASGWNTTSAAAYVSGVIIFEYKNSFGYKYDNYSRLVESGLFSSSNVNQTTNVITLNAGLPATLGNPDDPNGTWPIGTRIANCSSGSTYKYAFANATILPTAGDWYKITNFIGGVDASGKNYVYNFSPGATKVKLMWLANYSNRSGGYLIYPDTGASAKVRFTGFSMTPYQMSRLVDGGDGRKDLHIGRVNVAGTALETVSPTQTVEIA